jgi:hypothetical protein
MDIKTKEQKVKNPSAPEIYLCAPDYSDEL